jgi:hypothetical protein
VALVRTDVLEEHIASIIRLNRISDLRTTLALISKLVSYSLIRFTLMMKATCSSETSLQESHVTSQKTAFFIVIALKTSNLTFH